MKADDIQQMQPEDVLGLVQQLQRVQKAQQKMIQELSDGNAQQSEDTPLYNGYQDNSQVPLLQGVGGVQYMPMQLQEYQQLNQQQQAFGINQQYLCMNQPYGNHQGINQYGSPAPNPTFDGGQVNPRISVLGLPLPPEANQSNPNNIPPGRGLGSLQSNMSFGLPLPPQFSSLQAQQQALYQQAGMLDSLREEPTPEDTQLDSELRQPEQFQEAKPQFYNNDQQLNSKPSYLDQFYDPMSSHGDEDHQEPHIQKPKTRFSVEYDRMEKEKNEKQAQSLLGQGQGFSPLQLNWIQQQDCTTVATDTSKLLTKEERKARKKELKEQKLLAIKTQKGHMEDYPEPDPNYKPVYYCRDAKPYIPGLTLLLCYLAALVYYIYIRVTYTLDLKGWTLAYGIIVFTTEMIGALAMIIYGIALTKVTKKNPDECPADLMSVRTNRPYHIRVCVPCYKEDFAILKRTILAALQADLPKGCKRTVYLCDDGKDEKKKDFVLQMNRDDLVYVSGRNRPPTEVNGKSGNLNNCLQNVIYAEVDDIPLEEIVCIFDADQFASRNFFLRMVPYMDSGDNVGMVLSPQCFYNLEPHTDIWNHSNIHFWEYMQPGYDAINFISCTGTNFLMRSRALSEAGWFPADTITEDFGLGVHLTRNKQYCRYVEEYLAIGEAPTEVRNCFQQRSRWCKGHFQILFSYSCPLFDQSLPAVSRLLYTAPSYSYLSTIICNMVLLMVPIIAIWLYVFPLVINLQAVIAITVFYLATTAMQFYPKRKHHLEVLWFANISNTILWFTYLKAVCNTWRASRNNKVLKFKVTSKGSAKLGSLAFRDLWPHCVVLLVLMGSLARAIYNIVSRGLGIEYQAISMVWVLYNSIPYILVLQYEFMNPKNRKIWCRTCFILSFIFSICTVLILWAMLLTAGIWQSEYGDLAALSLKFYQSQKAGKLDEAYTVKWRDDSTLNDGELEDVNLSGGYYDGGASALVKSSVTNAFVVLYLSWSFRLFKEGISNAGIKDQYVDAIKWGAEYLMKLEVDDDLVRHVGDLETELDYWGRPEDIKHKRPIKFLKDDGKPTSVAAQVSAGLAAASWALQGEPNDNKLSPKKLLEAAESAFRIAERSYKNDLGFFYSYNGFEIPGDIPYFPETAADDMTLASAWLSLADNKNSTYLAKAERFWKEFKKEEEYLMTDLQRTQIDFETTQWPAALLLSQLGSEEFYYHIQDYLKDWMCVEEKEWWQSGPIGREPMVAFLATVYAESVKYNGVKYGSKQYSDEAFAYWCFAAKTVRSIVDGPQSYLVGYGKKFPKQPQDRAASCPSKPDKCTWEQFYTRQNNPHQLDGALVEGFVNDDTNFRQFNQSRVSIVNNVGFTALLPSLIQNDVSYAQCVFKLGSSNQKHAICGTKNRF